VTQTPQLVFAWLLAYADIIGGILGIIGSVILALPSSPKSPIEGIGTS
jgi:hypothetical protein